MKKKHFAIVTSFGLTAAVETVETLAQGVSTVQI